MTWQSTPSGEQWIERDDQDDYIGEAIPPVVRPHQTFARQDRYGNWDVFSWVPGLDGRPEPEVYVTVHSEADARLIVYGPELVRLASLALDALASPHLAGELRREEVINRLAEVVRLVKERSA